MCCTSSQCLEETWNAVRGSILEGIITYPKDEVILLAYHWICLHCWAEFLDKLKCFYGYPEDFCHLIFNLCTTSSNSWGAGSLLALCGAQNATFSLCLPITLPQEFSSNTPHCVPHRSQIHTQKSGTRKNSMDKIKTCLKCKWLFANHWP